MKILRKEILCNFSYEMIFCLFSSITYIQLLGRPYKIDNSALLIKYFFGRPRKPVLPFPLSEMPKGFCGFAVNMINLSAENLEIVTSCGGYGLRETLFYRLFGDLQVYKTRNDMRQAIPYLRNGAVSLDGGIIKGDGMLLLGDRSVIYFLF